MNIVFSHKIEGNYIKASTIIQNKNGNKFCIPYLKDGTFNLLIFNKNDVLDDFNINENLKLDNSTRPNDNFPFPMMDACFIQNEYLFVNIFMNKSRKMITFIYSSGNKDFFKSYVIEILPDNPGVQRNFPLGTFYDDKRKQVYMFFR